MARIYWCWCVMVFRFLYNPSLPMELSKSSVSTPWSPRLTRTDRKPWTAATWLKWHKKKIWPVDLIVIDWPIIFQVPRSSRWKFKSRLSKKKKLLKQKRLRWLAKADNCPRSWNHQEILRSKTLCLALFQQLTLHFLSDSFKEKSGFDILELAKGK